MVQGGRQQEAESQEAEAQEVERQEAETQEAEAQEAEVKSQFMWRKTQKDMNKEAARNPRPRHQDARGWYRLSHV